MKVRRFASVCRVGNIKVSIRWIPSAVNSSDRGSREHDGAYDVTKSLVDHLGSGDRRVLALSHAWPDSRPSSCGTEALTTRDGAANDEDFFLRVTSARRRRDGIFFAFKWCSGRAEMCGGIRLSYTGATRIGPNQYALPSCTSQVTARRTEIETLPTTATRISRTYYTSTSRDAANLLGFEDSRRRPCVAILAQAISCSNVGMISCVTSFSGFVLSKCLEPSFVVFHLLSRRVLTMDQTCQDLFSQTLLRILVLLLDRALIPTEWAIAHTMSSKSSEMCWYHSCAYSQILKITSRQLLML